MKKNVCFLMVLALMVIGAQAKIRLSHLIGSNMVLQQNTHVRLWGWAQPNSTVTVMTSWSDERAETSTDENGWWLTTILTPPASFEPLSLTFDDGEDQLTIDNVLSGEVWVCAGQSNMEMPVKGFGNCPVLNYNQEVIDAANYKFIRSVKVPSVMCATPLDDANCEWRECGPQTVGDFSATGYFFAKTAAKALNIPIGLIEANKGGTRVESWLTEENLKQHTTS